MDVTFECTHSKCKQKKNISFSYLKICLKYYHFGSNMQKKMCLYLCIVEEFAHQTNYESLMLFMKEFWGIFNFKCFQRKPRITCIYTIYFIENNSNQIVISHTKELQTYVTDQFTKFQNKCLWACHHSYNRIEDFAMILGLKINYENNSIQPTIKKFNMVSLG